MAVVSTGPAQSPADGPARPGGRPGRAAWLRGALLLVLVAVAVWYVLTHELPSVEQIHSVVEGFGIWGPLVFGLAYVLVAATPVPVSVMAASGGFLFGMAQGGVLGVVASTAGAWLGYWIARFLGRDALYRIAGRRVEAVETRLRGRGFFTVLVLRPVLPHWVLSYGAGLVRIPQRAFVAGTVLGGAPGQISLAAVGAFTSRPSWPALGVVAAAWLLVVVVGVLAWRRSRREHPGDGS